MHSRDQLDEGRYAVTSKKSEPTGLSEERSPSTEREVASPPARRRTNRSWLRRLALSFTMIYLLLCVAMFFMQRSLLYPRNPEHVSLDEKELAAGVTDLTLTTTDGIDLKAWYQPSPHSDITILFLHGNGGHRGYRREFCQLLRAQGAGVLALDYRGYGGSEGTPSEEGLYLDAEAAFRWIEENISGPIILMGESLGSGVAIEIARRHQVDGLIIHAGYSSITEVAQSHFPLIPIGVLLRDHYDSLSKIEELHCPKLFFHGKNDRIIPLRLGERLFLAAPEPKKWIAIENAAHNDLWLTDLAKYFAEVRIFVDAVADASKKTESQ